MSGQAGADASDDKDGEVCTRPRRYSDAVAESLRLFNERSAAVAAANITSNSSNNNNNNHNNNQSSSSNSNTSFINNPHSTAPITSPAPSDEPPAPTPSQPWPPALAAALLEYVPAAEFRFDSASRGLKKAVLHGAILRELPYDEARALALSITPEACRLAYAAVMAAVEGAQEGSNEDEAGEVGVDSDASKYSNGSASAATAVQSAAQQHSDAAGDAHTTLPAALPLGQLVTGDFAVKSFREPTLPPVLPSMSAADDNDDDDDEEEEGGGSGLMQKLPPCVGPSATASTTTTTTMLAAQPAWQRGCTDVDTLD